MALSELLNWIFGTGLVGTLLGILSLRSELKKAVAEARKAEAEADTVKITNTEQATRILVQNIVEPLRQELNETRKELKRENANLRNEIEEGKLENSKLRRIISRLCLAIEAIQSCNYRHQCPVSAELQKSGDGSGSADSTVPSGGADPYPRGGGRRQRSAGGKVSHRPGRSSADGSAASGNIEANDPAGPSRLDGEPESKSPAAT